MGINSQVYLFGTVMQESDKLNYKMWLAFISVLIHILSHCKQVHRHCKKLYVADLLSCHYMVCVRACVCGSTQFAWQHWNFTQHICRPIFTAYLANTTLYNAEIFSVLCLFSCDNKIILFYFVTIFYFVDAVYYVPVTATFFLY